MSVTLMHVGSKEEVGLILTALRKATGKSGRVVAQLAGINPGTLNRWEHGAHWPGLEGLDRLLRFYGETVTVGKNQGGQK